VRLIAATNRNMEEDVAKGTFRADLYYRVNVVSIFLPPLRERREDIPLLIEHFLDKFSQENARRLSISPEAMEVMLKCNWPGNVRELENCVERTATMARSNVIQDVDLPCQKNKCFSQVLQHYGRVQQAIPVMPNAPAPSQPEAYGNEGGDAEAGADPALMSERERLVWAMEQCGWVQAKAARLLNMTPRQIGYALQKYNIEVKRL